MYAGFYVANLRGERYSPRPCKREAEPSEHHEVGVQADALDPADPEEREAEVVLEVAELALNGGAATVKIAEAVAVTGDARVEAADRADGKVRLLALVAPERNDRGDTPRVSHSA
jgi:hypothetical protein